MEHKRKKQWILIIMLLLTVCSVFVVYAGREWMFTNPFKPYTFSSVSYASGDGDGCTYVIDDSNRKILKIFLKSVKMILYKNKGECGYEIMRRTV